MSDCKQQHAGVTDKKSIPPRPRLNAQERAPSLLHPHRCCAVRVHASLGAVSYSCSSGRVGRGGPALGAAGLGATQPEIC